MQAAVLRTADGPFAVEDVEIDPPRSGEIAVRVVGVGLCHTDILPRVVPIAKLPLVAGHEGAGVVEAIGPDVGGVGVGDHVVLSFDSCGRCESCLTAHPACCEQFGSLNMTGRRTDGSSSISDSRGDPVGGRWFGQSSFAERVVVRARNAVVVDKALPIEVLGPLGCGMLTGAGAVFNSLAVTSGASIAVFGTGSVGLAAVMAAHVAGASTIVAIDRNGERLDLARQLGATHVIEADDDLPRGLRSILPSGLHVALDTTGSTKVISTAIDALRANGVCGIVGVQRGNLTIGPSQLTVGRTLKGIIEGDAVPRVLIPRLITLWQQGSFPFDRLIRPYPFTEINEAEEAMRSGRVIKPVLVFSRSSSGLP